MKKLTERLRDPFNSWVAKEPYQAETTKELDIEKERRRGMYGN